jgi:hypothetical protein
MDDNCYIVALTRFKKADSLGNESAQCRIARSLYKIISSLTPHYATQRETQVKIFWPTPCYKVRKCNLALSRIAQSRLIFANVLKIRKYFRVITNDTKGD